MQMEYYGTLFFGTPSQSFTVAFSTGQAWTWLNDISCGKRDCHPSKQFNRSESSTYEETPFKDVEVIYGSGAYGLAEIGYDTVHFSPGKEAVSRQPFLLMSASEGLNDLSADGIAVSCI